MNSETFPTILLNTCGFTTSELALVLSLGPTVPASYAANNA